MIRTVCSLAIVFVMTKVLAVVNTSLMDAYLNGAEAKIIYKVVDDEGRPVEDATAHIWFRNTHPKLVIDDWVMNTDSNGIFIAEYRTNDRLSCGIDKPGYYHTFDRVTFSDPKEYKVVKAGKWIPYGNTRVMVLKRIKNPVLHSSSDGRTVYQIPSWGEWLGFDLLLRDWISPYGNGRHNDVLLRFNRQEITKYHQIRTMDVAFTNNLYAGAYVMTKDSFSDMDTDYIANTNKRFQACFTFRFEQIRRIGLERSETIRDELSENQYMVFRTRTKVEHNGNLLSCHYGIIHGNWRFYEKGGMSIGRVLFNCTPNDTNLEDQKTLLQAQRMRGGR